MSRGDTGTCCSVCDAWYYYTTRGGVPVEDDGVCWSCRRICELRWLRFCDAWQAIGLAATIDRWSRLSCRGDYCATCLASDVVVTMREAVS